MFSSTQKCIHLKLYAQSVCYDCMLINAYMQKPSGFNRDVLANQYWHQRFFGNLYDKIWSILAEFLNIASLLFFFQTDQFTTKLLPEYNKQQMFFSFSLG